MKQIAFLIVAAFSLQILHAGELPEPDGKPADQTKPVKVFILLGQSNMLGFGKIGPADKNGTLG
ncbi:MAG: hypothetical protein KDB27_25065 [Planctomycetales bacterium]|nr:hypothetical protein [Planctomycetales bacterium]